MINVNTEDTLSLDEKFCYFMLNRIITADFEKYLHMVFPSIRKTHFGYILKERYCIDVYTSRIPPLQWSYTSGRNLPHTDSPNHGVGLISLYAHTEGISLKEAMNKISIWLKLPMQFEQLMCTPFLPIDRAEKVIESFPEVDKLSIHPVMKKLGIEQNPYQTTYHSSDGRQCCIVITYTLNNQLLSLPISAWIDEYGDSIFEYVAPLPPYPVFNLLKLKENPKADVLLAPDELRVFILANKCCAVLGDTIVTTWLCGYKSIISDVDWTQILYRNIKIFVDFSANGYRKARKLYKVLTKLGAKSISFVTNKPLNALSAGYSHSEYLQAVAVALHVSYYEKQIFTFNDFAHEANAIFKTDFDYDLDYDAPTLRQFLKMPTPDAEWVLPGLIRVKDRVLIYAEKGVGKTWFTSILYFCMAAGRDFPGIHNKGGRPRNILVIDGENSKRELEDRTRQIMQALALPESVLDNIRIESAALLGRVIDLSREAVREALADKIAWADVVVLDNLNALWSMSLQAGPESSTELNDVVNEWSLQNKVIFVVNHASRGGKSFGSSTKEFGMETVIHLTALAVHEGYTRIKADIQARSGTKPPSYIVTLGSDGEVFKINVEETGTKQKALNASMNSIEKSGGQKSIPPSDSPQAIELLALDDGQDVNVPIVDNNVQDSQVCTEETPLSPEEILVLKFTQQGFSLRKIESTTKEMEESGDDEIKCISKSRAGEIVKSLKARGHLSD